MKLRPPISLRPLLACVLAFTCTAYVHAEQKQRPHKQNRRADSRTVEQLEEQWRQALLQADTVSLDKLLADDFTGISSNGTVSDKHQYLNRFTRHETEFKQIDVLEERVKVQPGLAIATSEARILGSLETRPLRGIFRYVKVYTRDTAGQWKLLSFEATRVSGQRSDMIDMQQGQPLGSPTPAPTDAPHSNQ